MRIRFGVPVEEMHFKRGTLMIGEFHGIQRTKQGKRNERPRKFNDPMPTEHQIFNLGKLMSWLYNRAWWNIIIIVILITMNRVLDRISCQENP